MNSAKHRNMSGAFYFYFLGKTGVWETGNRSEGRARSPLSLATEGTICRNNILNLLEVENIALITYIGQDLMHKSLYPERYVLSRAIGQLCDTQDSR